MIMTCRYRIVAGRRALCRVAISQITPLSWLKFSMDSALRFATSRRLGGSRNFGGVAWQNRMPSRGRGGSPSSPLGLPHHDGLTEPNGDNWDNQLEHAS